MAIEAGIGGLFDTTNVRYDGLKIGVLTSLEQEHTELLGNTLRDIAFQKMGLFGGAKAVVVPSDLNL